jgi:hypothetical protein
MKAQKPLADPNAVTKEDLLSVIDDARQVREKAKELYDRKIKVADLMEKHQRVYARLKLIIPKHSDETVLAMENHKNLLSQFLYTECHHAFSLQDAINNLSDNKILVYITEIFLYGVFTLPQYVTFIGRIQYEDDDCKKIPYTPKQITLSGFPQRIVFMCSGDNKVVDKIKRYCQIHFKSDVQINNNGDTTDIIIQSPIVRNLEESQKLFEQFCEYVNDREDLKQFNLNQVISKHNDTTYIVNSLADHRDIMQVEELLEKLSCFPVTINININNGGTFINGNNNVTQITKDKIKSVAKDWIRKNPPKNREKKSDYYDRYKNSIANCLSDRVFAMLVPGVCGCESLKSAGYHYWIYNK